MYGNEGYYLDIDWLRAMGGNPEELSAKELVQRFCTGPFASSLFDEVALQAYLEGRSPRACRTD